MDGDAACTVQRRSHRGVRRVRCQKPHRQARCTLRRANMSELLEQKSAARSTQEVLTHHLNCFGDIDGTMADYSAEARFFTPGGLLRGSAAIRSFFVRLFEEFAKPGMAFEILQHDFHGDT